MPVLRYDRLADAKDPRLNVYRDLPNSSPLSGSLITEGFHLFERLLASRVGLESVLVSQSTLARVRPLVPAECPLFVFPKEQLQQLLGYSFHRGCLACGKRPAGQTLSQLVDDRSPTNSLVICPHISDPENVGAIIRSAAAFGADGLLLGAACADPFSRKSLRVSMGAALQLPIRQVHERELVSDVRILVDELGFQVVASVLNQAAYPLSAFRRQRRLAILLGSEGDGLDTGWRDLATDQITIPVSNRVDSLNVGTAAAVMLYELLHRQSDASESL